MVPLMDLKKVHPKDAMKAYWSAGLMVYQLGFQLDLNSA